MDVTCSFSRQWSVKHLLSWVIFEHRLCGKVTCNTIANVHDDLCVARCKYIVTRRTSPSKTWTSNKNIVDGARTLGDTPKATCIMFSNVTAGWLKSESLFCVYFESVWPTQQPNGFRTIKSCKIHEINKNATTLSRTHNEAQVQRLPTWS